MRRRDDEKQRRIKDAVMQLILEEGFAGASISKIAKRAGVSPATVYIYYENKDEMLRELYLEYAEDSFTYLTEHTDPEMDASELIETLMRSYYAYIHEHREIYSFVDQFSHCPALSDRCSAQSTSCALFRLIDEKKREGEIRNVSDDSIATVLFYPVKAVAMMNRGSGKDSDILDEVIELIKQALLL